MSDFGKLVKLSWFEMFILGSAVLSLPVVAWLLKKKGFRRTEKLLARFSRQPRSSESDATRVDETARMVSVAGVRGPWDAQCLEQAITLWWMLGIMGIESTVRLGIYKTSEGVEAHAWVLHEERIVIGETGDIDDFTPLVDVNINRR